MRRVWMSVVAMGLLAAGWSLAGDEAAAVQEKAPAPKAIALMRVGSMDEALFDRVVKFVQENSALRVRVLPPQAATGESLDEDARAAAKAMGPSEECLVVLDYPKKEIKSHCVYLPDDHVAVVNAWALKPADGDQEKYGRRLERETMHNVGLLLGAPNCPNPQCALWQYNTEEELDSKGRNFCPPCLMKVQDAAKAKGVQINAESPFAAQ